MMNSQNSDLKIIKARVEQDKYAAVELKIIKANGVQVERDLYVEKEFNDSELFVASDNVLVSLHRALRNGEVANLELIDSKGNILIKPEFSEIKQCESNLFVAVKASSNMISVKNNQALKTDALKVQEIAADSKNIKDQMISTMKATNPNHGDDFKFLFEDAYNEAEIYKIDKVEDKYQVKNVGERASFIATDGANVYSHSNIVTDLTKIEVVNDAVVKEDNVDITSIALPTVEKESPAAVELQFGKIDDSVSMFEKYAPKTNNIFTEEEPILKDTPVIPDTIPEVNLDKITFPEFKKNILDKPERKEEVYSNSFFDDATDKKEDKFLVDQEVNDVKDNTQTFDDFFGVGNETSSTLYNSSTETEEYDGGLDQYEQLGEMITRLINEDKVTKEKMSDLEEQVVDLKDELKRANIENDDKTKKVNTLINENRRFGDENRALKNRISGLESKTKRLEEENSRYIDENNKLKEDAKIGKNKINAVISSIDQVLGNYSDTNTSYAVKTKIA